jgi:hypothetical protein
MPGEEDDNFSFENIATKEKGNSPTKRDTGRKQQTNNYENQKGRAELPPHQAVGRFTVKHLPACM